MIAIVLNVCLMLVVGLITVFADQPDGLWISCILYVILFIQACRLPNEDAVEEQGQSQQTPFENRAEPELFSAGSQEESLSAGD